MKNLELLPLSAEAKKRIATFARMYRQSARIAVEVVSFDGSRLIVRIEQKERINDKVLSKTDLEQRARQMFEGEIPPEWRLTVSAVNFDRTDIDRVDAEWVCAQMDRLGLKQKHLSTYTGIDKSTISTLLSEARPLTKWQRVAFYYLFKGVEFSMFSEPSTEG